MHKYIIIIYNHYGHVEYINISSWTISVTHEHEHYITRIFLVLDTYIFYIYLYIFFRRYNIKWLYILIFIIVDTYIKNSFEILFTIIYIQVYTELWHRFLKPTPHSWGLNERRTFFFYRRSDLISGTNAVFLFSENSRRIKHVRAGVCRGYLMPESGDWIRKRDI